MPSRSANIHKEMTVLDVVTQCPGADALFRQYDAVAGECICCCSLFETIEGLCRKYGFDLEKLMNELIDYCKHLRSTSSQAS